MRWKPINRFFCYSRFYRSQQNRLLSTQYKYSLCLVLWFTVNANCIFVFGLDLLFELITLVSKRWLNSQTEPNWDQTKTKHTHRYREQCCCRFEWIDWCGRTERVSEKVSERRRDRRRENGGKKSAHKQLRLALNVSVLSIDNAWVGIATDRLKRPAMRELMMLVREVRMYEHVFVEVSEWVMSKIEYGLKLKSLSLGFDYGEMNEPTNSKSKDKNEADKLHKLWRFFGHFPLEKLRNATMQRKERKETWNQWKIGKNLHFALEIPTRSPSNSSLSCSNPNCMLQ